MSVSSSCAPSLQHPSSTIELLRTPQPSCAASAFSYSAVHVVPSLTHRHVLSPRGVPASLLDICARSVAEHVPFQRVEERYDRIPEPVQRSIIFWSFPRNESDIFMYSSLCKSHSVVTSSSTASGQPASPDNLPFHKGLRLLENGCVENVLQVGFHLSGQVRSASTSASLNVPYTASDNDKRYKVSVSFDRCKITSVTCSCETRDIFWCKHVVALSLYRIRNALTVTLRVPISETLLQMNRQQLQKFVQYLISEHHTEVLPSAQRLADEILKNRSEINSIPGAPDPTAGACSDAESSWHLDEEQVKEQVRTYLSQGGGYSTTNKQLQSMFSKVREMLCARDSNGSRMLTLMTEQFLADPRLILWRSQGNLMQDRCRQLWDQLGTLWVNVTLNPVAGEADKSRWRELLSKWSRIEFCPLEDPDRREALYDHRHFSSSFESSSNAYHFSRCMDERNNNDSSDDEGPEDIEMRLDDSGYSATKRDSANTTPRTIFYRAIEASYLSWDNAHLRLLLSYDQPMVTESQLNNFNSYGQPLWREHLPTACSRVSALKAHGYHKQSLRLATAIVRNMRLRQNQEYSVGEASSCLKSSNLAWIGHPLDPIGCLFDTFAEASIKPDSTGKTVYYQDFVASLSASNDEETASATNSQQNLRYFHISAPGNRSSETLLCLGVESALIGLSQRRHLSHGVHAQECACKQEERIITRLEHVHTDSLVLAVLSRQARLLLQSMSQEAACTESRQYLTPMHTFAKYMFNVLLTHDVSLAQMVGLQAMRLPVVVMRQSTSGESEETSGQASNYPPRWYTLGHFETQQCNLASTMLSAFKDNASRLALVLESAQRYIRSSTHLFKLAQDAFRFACSSLTSPSVAGLQSAATQPTAASGTALPSGGHKDTGTGPSRASMLHSAALELGLQVLRMTRHNCMHWRRREMVRWLVTCATEAGCEALLSIMHNWYTLFSPSEATGPLAATVMSHATMLRLKLNFGAQEELTNAARQVALQCATKDPANCALQALTLCETDPMAFDMAYQIVLDASTRLISSSQLFTIARYMEHRGCPLRAYRLAMMAMSNIYLAYNQDSHPVISDIHWACMLSHSLGRTELSNIIPLLIKNVKCAVVLSDVLRRCSLSTPGLAASSATSVTPSAPSPVDVSLTSGHVPTGCPMSGSHEPKRRATSRVLTCDKMPLKPLLEATISAYVSTVHSRLTHISPRHYGEFIEFLLRARDTFLLTPGGRSQFASLLVSMRSTYKGKKKLMCLIRERFGA